MVHKAFIKKTTDVEVPKDKMLLFFALKNESLQRDLAEVDIELKSLQITSEYGDLRVTPEAMCSSPEGGITHTGFRFHGGPFPTIITAGEAHALAVKILDFLGFDAAHIPLRNPPTKRGADE